MHRSLAIAAVALAGLLAPAAASGATLAPLKPCYVSAGSAAAEREQIALSAQGFTPNKTATIALDGTTFMDNAQIDPLGAITGSLPAPYQAHGQRAFSLAITDNVDPAITVGAQALVTALDVHAAPADARPSSRVRFRGRGFTGGPSVYGHYVRKGRVRKTVLLGSASGPCGTFDLRRRQLPISHPHSGRWILQVDQDPVWHVQPQSVRVVLVIDVTRGPRLRTAGSQVPT